MSVEAEQTEVPDDRIPEAELRSVLASLARADKAVREHEEPRLGAKFDAKNRHWRRVYQTALTLGAKIDAEEG